MTADHEQIRRDAEDWLKTPASTTTLLQVATLFANHCLALLDEMKQAEKHFERVIGERNYWNEKLQEAGDRLAKAEKAIANASYALNPDQGERPDPVDALLWLRTTYPQDHPNYVNLEARLVKAQALAEALKLVTGNARMARGDDMLNPDWVCIPTEVSEVADQALKAWGAA